MSKRFHELTRALLALALLACSSAPAAAVLAQQPAGASGRQQQQQQEQQGERREEPQKFTGTLFGGDAPAETRQASAETRRPERRAGRETEPSSVAEPSAGAPDETARDAGRKDERVEAPAARDVEPAARVVKKDVTPQSYVRVTLRPAPRYEEAALQTATASQQQGQQPASPAAPSANNPPPTQGAPAQGPQTASPTQSQTQQSANPAAPAQGQQQPAQPAVPPSAPTQGLPTQTQVEGSQPAPGQPGQPQQQQQTPNAPGSRVGAPQGPRAPGRESVPTAAPADEGLQVPQVAEDFRSAEGPFPALERVGVQMGDQRALSLREASELALANNTDIEVARTQVRAAEFDLQAARGVYDPRFLTNSYYERSETPAASFLSGSTSGAVTQSGFFSNTSFQGLTPKWGGGYRVDFVSNRVTTDNQFAALNPQYPTALTFSYTQPVLRGRGFDQNRRFIEIASRNLTLTDAQFRQRAVETITQVQRAYWDLVFALRNLQIQRDAVRDARAQLEHNRRLVVEGLLAPIDVVAAEAQVSGFEQSVYTALDEVGRSENVLKNLIAENREAAMWNVALVPADPVELRPPAVDLQTAMDSALKSRPEIQTSDVAASINEVEQRFAREQAKPQIDLVGSYGVVGLAGTLNTSDAANPFTASSTQLRERINQLAAAVNGLTGRNDIVPIPPPAPQTLPDALVGGYGQSIANLAANRYNNFRVGVTVNLPIGNRTARAQLGRALVEGERIGTQREQLEQLIQVDVRNALQTVRTAESRLRAAASARSASEQQYASEKRKFDAGQSTLFLVLERQTSLTNARGNELRAQTELNKSIAELQRATGNALEAHRVEVRVR